MTKWHPEGGVSVAVSCQCLAGGLDLVPVPGQAAFRAVPVETMILLEAFTNLTHPKQSSERWQTSHSCFETLN